MKDDRVLAGSLCCHEPCAHMQCALVRLSGVLERLIPLLEKCANPLIVINEPTNRLSRRVQ